MAVPHAREWSICATDGGKGAVLMCGGGGGGWQRSHLPHLLLHQVSERKVERFGHGHGLAPLEAGPEAVLDSAGARGRGSRMGRTRERAPCPRAVGLGHAPIDRDGDRGKVLGEAAFPAHGLGPPLQALLEQHPEGDPLVDGAD